MKIVKSLNGSAPGKNKITVSLTSTKKNYKNLYFHIRQWKTFVRYWWGLMRCVAFTFFQHRPPSFPTEWTVMLLNMFSPNKDGYTMGLTQIYLIFHTASLSMQSFWVVLLFLRKQMLSILKHTFTDPHPPHPLLHPLPQPDVRIISCTYKEVCSCQSCQLVKNRYI